MGSIEEQTFTISNPFRTRILNGEITPLMSIKYMVGNEMAMMAKMAGFHAVFIDMEHSALDLKSISQFILACNYVGFLPSSGPPPSHTGTSAAFSMLALPQSSFPILKLYRKFAAEKPELEAEAGRAGLKP